MNIEKLDDKNQCKLIENVANGQFAVRAISNYEECNCIIVYLNVIQGETPCDVEHCEQSSCAVIKNNYDAETHTFKIPLPILRSDGTNALCERKQQVYYTPYQIPQEDRNKFENGTAKVEEPQLQDEWKIPMNTNNPEESSITRNQPEEIDKEKLSQKTTENLNEIQNLARIIKVLADKIQELTQNDHLDTRMENID
ncbi:hypothetical protein I4U23_004387 [Adineta vaga]|nr:hypothetical protein I4U23_004387 [Adineta vaga]